MSLVAPEPRQINRLDRYSFSEPYARLTSMLNAGTVLAILPEISRTHQTADSLRRRTAKRRYELPSKVHQDRTSEDGCPPAPIFRSLFRCS